MDNLKIITSENIKLLPKHIIEKAVILRWGYNKEKLNSWVKHMLDNSHMYKSFYLFCLKDDLVVGFSYFCEDEINPTWWYYGDLIVHEDYKRQNIATKMINSGIDVLRTKKANKLYTYVDNDNLISQQFHHKLNFKPSLNQSPINGYLTDNRTVYELTL